MSTAEGFRQEMPPKGGYTGIQWERIPLKKPWSGLKMISAYLLITAGSYWCYAQDITRKRNLRRLNDEVTTALEPMLIAERDRMYLNQLRLNRDEERELMKNVPGWKVGHYYSEPLYTTIGDFLMEPNSIEYYSHTQDKHRDYMHMFAFWM